MFTSCGSWLKTVCVLSPSWAARACGSGGPPTNPSELYPNPSSPAVAAALGCQTAAGGWTEHAPAGSFREEGDAIGRHRWWCEQRQRKASSPRRRVTGRQETDTPPRVYPFGVVPTILASSSMKPIHLPGCILENVCSHHHFTLACYFVHDIPDALKIGTTENSHAPK
jgi:hypothetical protein